MLKFLSNLDGFINADDCIELIRTLCEEVDSSIHIVSNYEDNVDSRVQTQLKVHSNEQDEGVSKNVEVQCYSINDIPVVSYFVYQISKHELLFLS